MYVAMLIHGIKYVKPTNSLKLRKPARVKNNKRKFFLVRTRISLVGTRNFLVVTKNILVETRKLLVVTKQRKCKIFEKRKCTAESIGENTH